MIRTDFFYLLLGLLFSINLVGQNNSNQDAYGYTFTTENTCNWIDITSIGTKLTGIEDDNFIGPISLGFDFQYYWNAVSELYISSNGHLGFEEGVISSTAIGFPNIPFADDKNNLLAPFLADLNFTGANNPGAIYFYTNHQDTCVISYIQAPLWSTPAPSWINPSTFQVILTATDSSITFNYLDMADSFAPEYINAQNPGVVGIENSTGAIGLQVSTNQIPADNSCIKFLPPAQPLLDIVDISPAWLINEQNSAIFHDRNQPLIFQTALKNSGNIDLSNNSFIAITISDNFGIPLLQQQLTVSPLSKGETWISPSIEFAFPTVGIYSVQVQSANSLDVNLGNDIRATKVVVTSTQTTDTQALSYISEGAVPNLPITFNTSASFSAGVGVYFQPPSYPFTIQAIDTYFFDNGAPGFTYGVKAEILADDGNNGQPGSVLASEDLGANQINNRNWISIPLAEPVTINAGGFYASIIFEGNDVAVGVANVGAPFSRRTFENIGGIWSEFRGINNNDLFIRVTGQFGGTTTLIPSTIPNVKLTAFPNPFLEDVQLQFSNLPSDTYQLTIFNNHGQRLIINQLTTKQNTSINYHWKNEKALPRGIYYYSLRNSLGQESTGKLVKQ